MDTWLENAKAWFVFKGSVSVSVESEPIYCRPGSQVEAFINVHGPGVKVFVSASSDTIVIEDVEPRTAMTPFTARLKLYVGMDARPGAHAVDIAVLDTDQRTRMATAVLTVFVINEKLREIAGRVEEYRRLVREKGVEYTLLKVLSDHNQAFSFTETKAIYELLVERPVSKGTVHDILKRLLKKWLVIKEQGGYAFNRKLRFSEAVLAIDIKRSLSGRLGALYSSQERRTKTEAESNKIPAELKRLIDIIAKLTRQGDYWVAVDLLAHTVIGARETGLWLVWLDDYFVYYEEKTRLVHYFRSRRLSDLLREMGFKEGFMGKHIEHPARSIIHTLYGSYPSARRIHYLLKEKGWFEYSEPLILELYYNEQRKLEYISLRDPYTNKELYGYGSKPKGDEKAVKLVAIPREHIDEENEETYFFRPAGLY